MSAFKRSTKQRYLFLLIFILLGNVFSVNVSCLDIRHWTTQEKTVLFFHPYYETAIMLASFMAAAFIVARAVELDTLVWSFGKLWEHNRSGASNVIVQSELSIINKNTKQWNNLGKNPRLHLR